MKVRRIKTLAIEIFKTGNELNPSFMKNIFRSKTNSRVRPFDLLVKKLAKVSWHWDQKYGMHYLKV